tara:strand:- start:805 stop:1113 length:309 start_codon:yes stop_codon:yes gene_type:complete
MLYRIEGTLCGKPWNSELSPLKDELTKDAEVFKSNGFDVSVVELGTIEAIAEALDCDVCYDCGLVALLNRFVDVDGVEIVRNQPDPVDFRTEAEMLSNPVRC